MSKIVRLNIFEIVGSPIWVSTDDGQKVFDKIAKAFAAGHSVELSFANHDVLITAFLNAAIGQLYNGTHSVEFLAQHLIFVDINDDDRAVLERSVENAKRYFAHRDAYDQAWEDVVDEDEE